MHCRHSSPAEFGNFDSGDLSINLQPAAHLSTNQETSGRTVRSCHWERRHDRRNWKLCQRHDIAASHTDASSICLIAKVQARILKTGLGNLFPMVHPISQHKNFHSQVGMVALLVTLMSTPVVTMLKYIRKNVKVLNLVYSVGMPNLYRMDWWLRCLMSISKPGSLSLVVSRLDIMRFSLSISLCEKVEGCMHVIFSSYSSGWCLHGCVLSVILFCLYIIRTVWLIFLLE